MRIPFFLLFLYSLCSFSQSSRFVDKESNSAVPFAVIFNQNQTKKVFTNINGIASLNVFSSGDTLTVRSLGYETYRWVHSSADSIFYLEPSAVSISAVPINAYRWKNDTNQVTQYTSSINRKEILLFNPQTSANVLSVNGDVYIQKSQQGGGSPIIRGFSANRLLYSIDGIRMNNAIYRSGNIHNIISLDPFVIEEVDVFYGSGSVSYGSDAIGGVMYFNTLPAVLSKSDSILTSGQVISRYSSANQEKTGHLSFNIGGKKWASLSSISFSDFGDLRMGSKGPKEYLRAEYIENVDGKDSIFNNPEEKIQLFSAYRQLNLMQKLKWQIDSNWVLDYSLLYSESSTIPRYDRLIQEERDGELRYARWYYGPQKWLLNALTLSHNSKTKLYDDFKLILAHQKFEESRINRRFESPFEFNQLEQVHAYSANLDLKKYVNKNSTFYYGGELLYNKVSSEAFVRDISLFTKEAAQSRYPESEWSSYSIYANYQQAINPYLNINAGIRYSLVQIEADFNNEFIDLPFKNEKINEDAIIGSFGIGYNRKNWILSTNISSAFRAPNIDDIGKVFESEPGAVVIPNSELESEYAYTLDFNVTKLINNKSKVQIGAYYTLLENALVRRNSELNGQDSIVYQGEISNVQAIQNAQEVIVYGLQLAAELKLSDKLNWFNQINFQEGEESLEEGRSTNPRHVPPTFGLSRLSFKHKRLSLLVQLRYNGEISNNALNVGERNKPHLYAIDNNGLPYSPAWYTLDFRAMYALNSLLSFTLGVENLTDVRYRSYSSGISGAGRNLIISINANF